jgi:hypothetical protein
VLTLRIRGIGMLTSWRVRVFVLLGLMGVLVTLLVLPYWAMGHVGQPRFGVAKLVIVKLHVDI